jgi:hypothetical protein
MMEACDELMEQPPFEFGLCVGAMSTAFSIASAECDYLRRNPGATSHTPPSLGQEVTMAQLAQIFVNWSRANPVTWTEPSGRYVALAIADAFPCPL